MNSEVLSNVPEKMEGSKALSAPASIRLAHVFEQFHKLGGVHSRLKKHLEGDRQWGIDSRFVITWEKQDRPQSEPMVFFLATQQSHTIELYRHRFKLALGMSHPNVIVYHTPDDRLYDLDQAERRIFFLNNQWEGMEEFINHHLQWADGVFSPSQPLCNMVGQCWAKAEATRVSFIPQPILPPGNLPPHPPLGGRPLVLGVCGRLLKRQKQVELLPPLFQYLDTAKLSYRVEFLGDGADRAWLEMELPDRQRFIFHGQKEGADYWSLLSQWDVLLSTTKFEAGPITVLEAMSVGVVPVFPDIPCQGQVYIQQLNHPGLLFNNGQWSQVATALQGLQRMPEGELAALRARGCQLMIPHGESAYLRTFSEAVKTISKLPKISATVFPERSWGWDKLTFKQYAKARRFKGYLQKYIDKTRGILTPFQRKPSPAVDPQL